MDRQRATTTTSFNTAKIATAQRIYKDIFAK